MGSHQSWPLLKIWYFHNLRKYDLVFSRYTQVSFGIFTIYASIIWYFHDFTRVSSGIFTIYASIIWYFHDLREYHLVFSRFTRVSSGIFMVYASIIWDFFNLIVHHPQSLETYRQCTKYLQSSWLKRVQLVLAVLYSWFQYCVPWLKKTFDFLKIKFDFRFFD